MTSRSPVWLRRAVVILFFILVSLSAGWVLAFGLIQVIIPSRPSISGVVMHPTVGELFPDFTLWETSGKEFHLADALGQKPLLIHFGNFSCPNWNTKSPSPLESLYQKYGDRVEFILVYGQESHPDDLTNMLALLPMKNGIGLTANWYDCSARASLFCTTMKTAARVLVDELAERNLHKKLVNSLYPVAPQPFLAMVVSTDGRVLCRVGNWNSEKDSFELQKCLEKLFAR